MTPASGPLPEFENPPVVEVALATQFETLTGLRTPQLGLLWQEFRDRFPVTEEHPPLESVIERFGVMPAARRGVRFQMIPGPVVPRCWFLNPEGTELVQVQQDRFAHNWRKQTVGGPYPRYDHIKATFAEEIGLFQTYLARHDIGVLRPNQCEVTYVNHIVAGEGWETHADLGEVLTVFSPQFSDTFLGLPEDGRLSMRFIIPDETGAPVGRLHISVEAAYRALDDRPLYILTLTARGRPAHEEVPEALKFLDTGREWIVRGFAAVSTPKMHSIWRRTR